MLIIGSYESVKDMIRYRFRHTFWRTERRGQSGENRVAEKLLSSAGDIMVTWSGKVAVEMERSREFKKYLREKSNRKR